MKCTDRNSKIIFKKAKEEFGDAYPFFTDYKEEMLEVIIFILKECEAKKESEQNGGV